jgi:hypothetical protein
MWVAFASFFLTMASLGALTMYWLDYLAQFDPDADARRMLEKYWVGGPFIGMICLAVLRRVRRR